MVPNGLLPNVAPWVTRRLDPERWTIAEERTAELIAGIQPCPSSEERRRTLADYVQRLVMRCLSCQAFTFGSVPLKTYLSDGDIDVTAFSYSEELKDTWASVVRDALQHEDKSENAEFHVKEVQYIQAEVKIIKCLVENIVVDISFNQVGGLCTLCFLEEMDNVIKRNHLFKRSIILIKAWCYYESRILGAHHGLISTYALETLVLYIFHVFNNCFSGPLEVLYRFLEFFSNFDWEKFCLSLWGPVPISSLPEMSAEPPRKDGGALLLSKSFLDECSSKYAVTPTTQDSQGHAFVSKHFNVVDPLRTSNNLGRSVSKGNFFRVRSAFAFGAKRLARLLECPKEDLVVEVNQFFTNTWRRHGSGNRPDAPTPSLLHEQPMKAVPADNIHRSATALKKKTENPVPCVDPDNLTEGGHSYIDSTTQLLKKISLQSQNSPGTVNSAIYPCQSQIIYGVQANTKVSEQLERKSNPGGPVQGERDQRMSKTHFSMNDKNGLSRFQFARTCSSPQLTDSSAAGFPRGRRNRVDEPEKSSKADYNSRRNNLVLEVSGNNSTKSSPDEQVSSMNASSHPNVKTASDFNIISSSYCEDIGFSMNEEHASVSEALKMLHKRSPEESVQIDLMASTKLHGLNGQVPLPVEIPSHLSVASPPLLASTGYSQRNLADIVPAKFSLVGTQWLPNMLFFQGFAPQPMTHYAPTTFATNVEDGKESEKSVAIDANRDEEGNWHEHDAGLCRNLNYERDPQMFHFDGKESSSSLDGVSGVPLQGQPKFDIEDRTTVRENYANMFNNQTTRGAKINANMRSGYVRFASSQAGSSRSKTLPDSTWDELAGVTPTSRDKWGETPTFPAPATSGYSKTKTSGQFEETTVCVSAELDDTRDGDALSIVKDDFSDRTAGTSSSTQLRTSHIPEDYDQSQVSTPNPVFAPFFIGSPQQRQVDNPGLTFVPTGPPVPFVMLPFVRGNTDESVQRNEVMDQLPLSVAVRNVGSVDCIDQHDTNVTSTACSSIVADHEQKSDILNSDFTSHWQNLQYGRFCQGACPPGSLLYPFPVPPVYLRGHFPWDGPGRPTSPNVNWAQIMGPGQRVIPGTPLQPASERACGVFQCYGEDAPRYCGGTGTYLPNPKVLIRDRQSSSRNYRGSYNSERGDHTNKEGSWINSNQRNAGRSYGRSQPERSSMRPDRQADECQSDRQWPSYRNDSHRHEACASYSVQGHSFGSMNSTRNPGNVTHGFYLPPSTTSNGALSRSSVPPVVMVYSFNPGVDYNASTEPLEASSLRPVRTMDGSDILRPTHEVLANGFYEHRHAPYRGGSSQLSPDQPSSPHLRR